jgi:hypothetical protein
MSALLNAVQAFIDDIKGEKAWMEEFAEHSRNIARHLKAASRDEVNEALRRFASLFPKVPIVVLGTVAVNCGALVENDGDPAIAGPSLLERLRVVNETAGDFCSRCRALAIADEPLVNELRAALAEGALDAGRDRLGPSDVVDNYIASEGWRRLADTYAQRLYEEHPTSVLGYFAEHQFRLGLIAHLCRSKALRAAARSQAELLDGTRKRDEVSGSHGSFIATMLQVLDNEPLVVLHVEQRKGFEVRISGIADNFQLHTLLEGAIIGAPANGWVDGKAPSARAIAQYRDAVIDERGGEDVTGAFNLYNWTALQPDGTLFSGLGKDIAGQWIWNEGCPADIAPFEGLRIVLLGPSPYVRNWSAGRQFQGMRGELTIERVLDSASVNDWLHRLIHASRS